MKFRDRLTSVTVNAEFRGLNISKGKSYGLIVNCLSMTGYEMDARGAFVEQNKRIRDALVGTAILTTNQLYRMVIGGMSLATDLPMRSFSKRAEAVDWLVGIHEVNVAKRGR